MKMSKRRDLTGRKFNRLTVIKFHHRNKRRKQFWLCRCDCGQHTVVDSSHLKTGNTKSCGCLNKELIAQRGTKAATTILALPVNHGFFSKWSDNMAYILGFWAADGCAKGKNKISFSQNEREVIERIKSALNSEHKVSCREYRDSKFQYTLTFSSDQITLDLKRIFGIPSIRAKSLTLPFPEVPTTFKRHFVRGCIDGDGCLGFYNGVPNISFTTGSHKFADGLRDCVISRTGIEGLVRLRSNQRSYAVHFNGIKAKCLSLWLYSDIGLSVQRKCGIAERFWEWSPKIVMPWSVTEKMLGLFSDVIPRNKSYRGIIIDHA